RLRVKGSDIDDVGTDAARQHRKLDRLALPVGKAGFFRGTHGVPPVNSLQQFRNNWTTSPSAGSPHSRRPLTRPQSSSSPYSSSILKAARRSPSSSAAWACRNRSSTSSFSSRPRRQLQRKRFISAFVIGKFGGKFGDRPRFSSTGPSLTRSRGKTWSVPGFHTERFTISSLILPIARVGLRFFGQESTQFMML